MTLGFNAGVRDPASESMIDCADHWSKFRDGLKVATKTNLRRPLRLTAVLRINHFAELEKAGRANAWVVNQCDPDHAYRWVDVARLLAK